MAPMANSAFQAALRMRAGEAGGVRGREARLLTGERIKWTAAHRSMQSGRLTGEFDRC
ncbi:hypothetical protein [Burkholderia territorii]|uniref:hypothetical protein n=1 Tax=Burkholderia territorii TaxID=1503055 RepID=UPI000A6CF723|nr:hypothetical protein [Burkholderia territorii]